MVILTSLVAVNCAGIPKAPKLDIGLLKVERIDSTKYSAQAFFTNQQNTEWTETIDKLDKHFVFRGDQLIDVITWLDKVLVTLKKELIRNQKK